MSTLAVNSRHLQMLEHMLGAGPHSRKRDWGYRNHYCVTVDSADHDELRQMEEAGLVKPGRQFNEGSAMYYHATHAGCEAAGLHKAAIKRAFRK